MSPTPCGVALSLLTMCALVQGVHGQSPPAPATAPTNPRAVTLALKPPPARLVVIYGRETAFAVSTSDRPATNLRIVHATLQDAATGAQLGPAHLWLCFPTPSDCAKPINLTPNTTARVTLRIAPAFQEVGTFTGLVALTADDKSGTESFDLTVLATSRAARLVGAALIAAGIALSWIVLVVMRQIALRADALLPAAQLGDAVRELCAAVARAEGQGNVKLPALVSRLDGFLAKLKPATLEGQGFIPPRVAVPFRAAIDRTADYKKFLSDLSLEVLAVSVVVKEGVQRAIREIAQPNATGPVRLALGRLDLLANVSTADDARKGVGPVITKLLTDLGQPQPQAQVGFGAVRSEEVPTVLEVRAQLRQLSLGMWFIWGVLTLVIGAMTLILSNDGFGTALDYCKSFHWGLGVQVAGQQLQQLAPNTVGTALAVTFPKAQ
jgi:hypothetical protein